MNCKFVAAFAAIMASGCVSSGRNVSNDELSHFEKGSTTETEVVKALGAPQSTTTASDGTQSIVYVWTHAQPKAASFIPVVGLFAGGATGQANLVTFKFDHDGKLESYTASQSNTDVHTGLVVPSGSAPSN